MLNAEADNKSTQSFRIPLEIVREDRRHDQHHHSSAPAYGGDLLLSVTYKRNILKVIFDEKILRKAIIFLVEKRSTSTVRSIDKQSFTSVYFCWNRSCLWTEGKLILKNVLDDNSLSQHAAQTQARHDARLNYPAQVGVNTYAKLSLSFLSDTVKFWKYSSSLMNDLLFV